MGSWQTQVKECDGCGEPTFLPDLVHHWNESLCALCEYTRHGDQELTETDSPHPFGAATERGN